MFQARHDPLTVHPNLEEPPQGDWDDGPARAAAEAIRAAVFVGVAGLGHDLPQALAVDLIGRVAAFS